jgi:signal transduction histidine kinase
VQVFSLKKADLTENVGFMKLKSTWLLWLPYFVAIFGIMTSIALWFLFHTHLQAYVSLLIELKSLLPWLALAFSLGIFLLIAALIRMVLLARLQSSVLKQTHEDLKNEISDRIHAEETKQKLEVALLQGQKLQAIGTLAGGIAHDFNNILYAIIGYVEMTREDLEKNSIAHKNLGKVLDATHRGQDLISRILAFSRRQHHHFDPINLKSTIEAALSMLRPTIPTSVIIHFQALDIAIFGNQTQIHQVLVNLINNAVDAMDGEGKLNIIMSHILANDALLKEFPDIQAKNYCKIEISDTGHGMDHATMDRIFEPFFTTKEVGKGTGLGLSIVHSIIKEHEGEIAVHSRLGHGSTFMILLPESESAETVI